MNALLGSTKYSRLPSQDEEIENENENENDNDNEIENEIEAVKNKLVGQKNKNGLVSLENESESEDMIRNLNEPKPIRKVINPLFDVDEYFREENIIKNNTNNNNNSNNNTKNTNKNKNNNHIKKPRVPKPHFHQHNERRTNDRNNSFLNILSRTIRGLMSPRSAKTGATPTIQKTTHRQLKKPASPGVLKRRSSDLGPSKEIRIDLGHTDEREVELKMKIPRRCFKTSDIQKLNENKCVKLLVSSSDQSSSSEENEYNSSSSSSGDDDIELGNRKSTFPVRQLSRNSFSCNNNGKRVIGHGRRRSSHYNWADNTSSIDESRVPLYQRRSTTCDSSTMKRRILVFIVVVSIIVLIGLGLVMYLTEKSSLIGFDFMSNFLTNHLRLNNKTTTTTIHQRPKHKLHFWQDEVKSSGDDNDDDGGVSNGAVTKLTRQVRNQSDVINTTTRQNLIINSSFNESGSGGGGGDTVVGKTRLYDRLSILIDHDLFKKLNFKYLPSPLADENETNLE